MNTYDANPEVKRIIEEMNALNAVLRATTPEQATEAREKVRTVENSWPEPVTIPDFVLRASMSRITGTVAPQGNPALSEDAPWSTRAFELVSLAWLAWSRNDNPKATNHIVEWAEGRKAKNLTSVTKEGAVQAYCVSLWSTAVTALLTGNMEEARRHYRRVYEVGSSFGTESHPVILWTRAATFTPVG
jgi:hypothetical protein